MVEAGKDERYVIDVIRRRVIETLLKVWSIRTKNVTGSYYYMQVHSPYLASSGPNKPGINAFSSGAS